MGQFSWITSDTDRSVLCDGTVKVKMLSPDGRVFPETNYEGYGVFGGMDYFSLLAELNGKGDDRQEGIDLFFTDNQGGDPNVAVENGVVLPKIVSIDAREEFDMYPESQSCPEQGWRQWDEEEDTCYYCGEELDYCTCDDLEDKDDRDWQIVVDFTTQ